MDDFKSIMTNWGLGEYVLKFEDEGIDNESFLLLDKETIQCLINKKGHYLKFCKKFNDLCHGYGGHTEIHEESVSSGSTVSLPSSDTDDASEINIDQDFLLQFPLPSPPKVMETKPDFVFKEPAIPSPKRNVSDVFNEVTAKQRKIDSFFANGLEKYLESQSDGRLVLLNRHKLNNHLRQKLSRVVVNYIVSKNFNNPEFIIKADIFSMVAKEIVQIFPNERIDTYYIPFTAKSEGLRQPARGKLWSRYINVRAALRMAKSNNQMLPSDEKENISTDSPGLQFLKSAIEPLQKLIEAWEETHLMRKRLYRESSVDDIFNEFPSLKTDHGIELLELDFNQDYEDKIDIIYNEWPKVSEAILKEADQRHTKLYGDNEADVSMLALLTLPYLFSPTTIKKSKTTWRPTRTEIQESFFIHVKTLDELEHLIEKRRAKLAQYEVPFQPFGAAVGETLHAVKSFYIVLNNIKYHCMSSIRCLELVYKCIHALNLEYPLESKNLWLLIEDLVFKMGRSHKNSSTAGVTADILYHLQD